MKLLKTISNRRMAYLVSLDHVYREEGYKTKLDGFNNILEVYSKDSNQDELDKQKVKCYEIQ